MSYCCLGDFGDETPPPQDANDPNYVVPETPLVLLPQASSEATATSPLPSGGVPPDPEEQYSKYYKLSDLVVTSLPFPNLPMDQVSQDNLRRLAGLLDLIREKVGEFTIASAYRSPENQAALKGGSGGADAAAMAVKNSYHSQGLAADITPTNGMTPSQFAAAIYLDTDIDQVIGQITDKSEGGNETSLHISLQTPRFPKATLMYVGDDKQYYRMTISEVESFLQGAGAKAVAAVSEAASEAVSAATAAAGDVATAATENPVAAAGIGVGTLAALGIGGFFLWRFLQARKA